MLMIKAMMFIGKYDERGKHFFIIWKDSWATQIDEIPITGQSLIL